MDLRKLASVALVHHLLDNRKWREEENLCGDPGKAHFDAADVEASAFSAPLVEERRNKTTHKIHRSRKDVCDIHISNKSKNGRGTRLREDDGEFKH